MLSRRRFLIGSAAVALAHPLGPSRALAGRGAGLASPGRHRPAAVLVAALPAGMRRGEGAACPRSAAAPLSCLQSGGPRSGRLATVEIATGAGAAGWRLAAQALRSQVGGARRLGLVCWGDAGAWPVGNALDDGLGDALGAIVLLDRVDLPQGARPSVLCHLARRRSPAEQRAIARRLAALERAGTPMLVHWYDAAPGFAAPELAAPELAAPGLPALGGAAPGLAAADRDRLGRDGGLAWRRTVTFLARHLDPSTAGRTPTIG